MYEHLGSPLAVLRKSCQLSQAEVAELLTQMGIPVTNRAISHWEQERAKSNGRIRVVLRPMVRQTGLSM